MIDLAGNALEYLKKDYWINVDMIEPIRMNQAKFIYAAADGVLLVEKRSSAIMAAFDKPDKALALLLAQPPFQAIRLTDEQLVKPLMNHFHFSECMKCHQVVYPSKDRLPESNRLMIKTMRVEDFEIVKTYYNNLSDEDLMIHLRQQDIYGGYYDGHLVGFIGTHLEGSIGILFVLSEFRQRGFASELESFMINHQLAKNLLPYAQVKTDNEQSKALQRKLGMKIVEKPLFWLF